MKALPTKNLLVTLAVFTVISMPTICLGQEIPEKIQKNDGLSLKKIPPHLHDFYRCAYQGMDWLVTFNRADGRFYYGYEPSLRAPLEGDNFIDQVAATHALARSARYFENEKAAVIARQALLTLLLETEIDSSNPKIRKTSAPNATVNRLAAAGWLVMAINELPNPGKELLQQSEQLCNYIRSQQNENGSLCFTDNRADTEIEKKYPVGVQTCTGPALYGLMSSLRNMEGAWKVDVVRKACRHYHAYWRAQKNSEMVPFHSAAYAQAYRRSKDEGLLACVNEMNDWLCGLQHQQTSANQTLWYGGFYPVENGKAISKAPSIVSASYLEGLSEARQLTRLTGDVERYQKYSQALHRCGVFCTTLQYTAANTNHFQPKYRDTLIGGFHPTHRDGTLRIDYAQLAVAGLVKFLEYETGNQ